jgi:hypothetical protein
MSGDKRRGPAPTSQASPDDHQAAQPDKAMVSPDQRDVAVTGVTAKTQAERVAGVPETQT